MKSMVILVLTLRRTLNFEASFHPVGNRTESPFIRLDSIFKTDFTEYTARSFEHHRDHLCSPVPSRVCSQQRC